MVNVDSASEVVILLPGFDSAGRPLFASVVSLPRGGALFQLAHTYSTYAYAPARGAPITSASTATPARVTGSRARLVFAAPASAPPTGGPWGVFTYTVSDGTSTSPPGTVWVFPSHRRVAWSDFTDGNDGWVISDNGGKEAARPAGGAVYESLSRGRLLNHYLLGSDAEIAAVANLAAGAGGAASPRQVDVSRWRFVAPPAFRGSLLPAYGGLLRLDMGSFAGDFSAGRVTLDVPLVTMECGTCGGGAGVRLGVFPWPGGHVRSATVEASTRTIEIPMSPAYWRRDPRNSLAAWGNVSDCEFAGVLSAVSRVTVLGDQTSYYETVAIDNVGVVHAVPFAYPKHCMG